MEYSAINVKSKFSQFSEQWTPKIIGKLNDYHLKIARVEGEFVWHSHPETDEMFLVVEGELELLFRDGSVTLTEGEMYVVAAGVEHKPVAKEECKILMIEPSGTVNTGDAGGERTVEELEWL